MSERMTNVEIEDILSSIRRLVAEEARPPLTRQPPKLVLTDAERVRPAEPAPPAPRDGAAGPSAEAEDALEARIAELETLLGMPRAGLDGPFEADEGDPFDRPPAVRHPAAQAVEPVEAAPRAAAPAPARPPVLELVGQLRRPDPTPPDPTPPDPEPALRQNAEPAPEPSGAAPGAPDSDAPLAAAPDADGPVILHLRGAPGRSRAADPAPPEPAPPEPAPDRDEDHAWEAAPAGTYFDPAPDEDVIDEDTLRDIVRDILRDELQGELGERITRNLRKLIRAEIARALATRDL